jgi:hypothetical protein
MLDAVPRSGLLSRYAASEEKNQVTGYPTFDTWLAAGVCRVSISEQMLHVIFFQSKFLRKYVVIKR